MIEDAYPAMKVLLKTGEPGVLMSTYEPNVFRVAVLDSSNDGVAVRRVPEIMPLRGGAFEVDDDNYALEALAELVSIVERYSDNDLQKAREGLVKKLVTIRHKSGKTYQAYRLVRPEGSKPVGDQKKRQASADKEVRINEKNAWFQHALPSPEVYQKIQAGDGEALAAHLQSVFFKQLPGTDSNAVRRLVFSIPQSRIESYEIEDILQETMLRTLVRQSKGAFAQMNIKFFPATIASTIANTAREVARSKKEEQRGKYQKIAQDISELADELKSDAASPEEQFVAHESMGDLQKKLGVIYKQVSEHLLTGGRKKNTKTQGYARAVWERVALGGETAEKIAKDMKIPLSNVKLVATKGRQKLTELLQQNGLDISPKQFSTYMRNATGGQERRLKLAASTITGTLIMTRDGRLLLKGKKAEIGEVRTRKDGTKKRKVAPGKWETVKESGGGGKGKDGKKKSRKGGRDPIRAEVKASRRQRLFAAIKDGMKSMFTALADTLGGKKGDESARGVVRDTEQTVHTNVEAEKALRKKRAAVKDAARRKREAAKEAARKKQEAELKSQEAAKDAERKK